MLIRTKRQYFELAQAGLAGNSPKTWGTVEEFLSESQNEFVGIRCLRPGSNLFRYNVPRGEVTQVLYSLGLINGSGTGLAGDYYLSTMVPGEEVIVSGELGHQNGDWVFYHSFLQLSMRDALKFGGQHAIGYHAVWSILKSWATPADIEDLFELFERYSPNYQYPVIELTVTKRDWGIFPKRNILIWEVRHF